VGNRLSRNDSTEGRTDYAYDGNNRLVSEALAGVMTQFAYDNDGNLLSRIKDATDQAFYHWDSENRLTSAEVTQAGITHQEAFGYDSNGNRVFSAEDGIQTHYLNDTNLRFVQVVEEYQTGSARLVDYVRGLNLIEAVRGGVSSFYLVDGLGSTRALASAAGAITDTYAFDAFGRTLSSTGGTANTFLFAGEQAASGVSLDYLRARYLDPSLGRFVSADPVSGNTNRPISFNKFVYADANPVNRIDPSGKFTLLESGVVDAIENILQGLDVSQRVTSFCRLLGSIDTISTFAQLGAVVLGFFSEAFVSGFKPGFQFVAIKPFKSTRASGTRAANSIDQIDKIKISIDEQEAGIYLKLAIDLNNGGRFDYKINVLDPADNTFTLGFESALTLFEIKECGIQAIVGKLAATGDVNNLLDANFKVAFSVKVLGVFKIEFPLLKWKSGGSLELYVS
jgi:RHS repeat-associated protein